LPRPQLGPDGYRVALPEGWVGLNVRENVDAVVAEALTGMGLDSLPRDERPKRRAAVEGRLRLAVENAKKIDAYAMYVPLHGMHGLAIPASFIVAEATDFSGGGPEEDVLGQLLNEPDAQLMVIDGSNAVRTQSTTEGRDEVSGTEVPARQVVYTVAVPDTPQWLVIVFDVIAGTHESDDYMLLVDALVMLFDGIMTTFRWNFFDRS
jgi:hypothetical protein